MVAELLELVERHRLRESLWARLLSIWDRRLIRHRTKTACTVEDGSPSRSPISTGPSRCFHRKCTILRTTGGGVRFGRRCGRDDRSTIPAGPSAR